MLRAFDLIRKATLGCGLALAMFGTAYAGKVNVLYPFKGGNDGAEPISGVISDSQGNLYGTTWQSQLPIRLWNGFPPSAGRNDDRTSHL